MSRNKERNQKTKEDRKEQILSASLRLFVAKGLSATKITDIAVASGMSQGLLYHYYRSKEEIFVKLIQNAFETMNTASLELEKLPLTPREKIRLALEKLLLGLANTEETSLYYLLIAVAATSDAIPEEAKTIIHTQNQVVYEVITRIILAGQRDGSIKNYKAEDLALIFWTSMKGLAVHKAAYGKKFQSPDPDILMGLFM